MGAAPMTDTTIVFMTGTLLSFPVLYWMLDRMLRKEGPSAVRAPRTEANNSEGSAFQRLLIRESLDRVLRLFDDLQADLTHRPPRPGPNASSRRTTALSEDHRRSLAECTDLVSVLLADDDARHIRTALARLEKTTTLEEFVRSLGHARSAIIGLRQDLADLSDQPTS